MIVWQRPNLLLLDEPTNHLDLATREALSMALNEFEGTVMLVSHDRALLRAVCDEFWMVSQGGVAPFDGDLDDYQKYLLDHAKKMREDAKKASAAPAAKAADKAPVAIEKEAFSAHKKGTKGTFDAKKPANNVSGNAAKQLRKELDKIDAQMQQLIAEKDALQTQLASAKAPAELAQTGKRCKAVDAEIGTLEERWLELTEQLDTASV
jgi:ATP-binding cassette subfamily F protein 3